MSVCVCFSRVSFSLWWAVHVRRCIHLWAGRGRLSISSSLSLTHTHTCTHVQHTHAELSGPLVLYHHTPPLDHLNGTNPDCCKSSRVHAENVERGGEGRWEEKRRRSRKKWWLERDQERGQRKKEMGSREATRKVVKSAIFGVYDRPEEWLSSTVEQFPPLWLHGCWLVHVIMFIFRRKHEMLPTLSKTVENYEICKEKNNMQQFSSRGT